MNLRMIAYVALYALAAHGSQAQAAPVPAFDLRKLIAESDLIAIGTVRNLQRSGTATIQSPTGSIDARVFFADMRVDQILKGPLAISTVRFRFAIPETWIGYQGVDDNSYRIIFLRRSGDGYEFVSPYHPSVVALAGAPVQAPSAEDRVLMAIARGLTSPTLSAEVATEVIHALWAIKDPKALSHLALGLHHSDAAVRLTAAAALLAGNDTRGLPAAEAELSQYPTDVDPALLHNLRVGISEGLSQFDAVPSLSRLLMQGDDETRRAVTTALGRMPVASAIRALSNALNDRDFDVRLNAARALANLSGRKELTPSEDAFRDDERRFAEPLRNWAVSSDANR